MVGRGGAYAIIRLFWASVDGPIEALHVDAHHLTFAFVYSGVFEVDLHR